MSLSSWVRRDGLLHAETCALITIVLALWLPAWCAALVAVACGIGKELWDKGHGGAATWHDIICDLAGTIAAILIVILAG